MREGCSVKVAPLEVVDVVRDVNEVVNAVELLFNLVFLLRWQMYVHHIISNMTIDTAGAK
jgi:hypothetical protein